MEEDRVVCIRFGHDHNEDCMAMDETLYGVSEKVQNFAVLYLGECSVWLRGENEADICGIVDITEVPDFNKVGLSLSGSDAVPPSV